MTRKKPSISRPNVRRYGAVPPTPLRRRMLRGAAVFILTPVLLILILRWVPVPTSSFILTRQIGHLFEDRSRPDVLHFWTPRSRIPGHMALAVVAAEDQNFPKHHGFDLQAISRAMEYNASHRTTRGASTITQQTAKNLFLWSGRSFVRKGLEAGLTILLELLWSKERILEVYLNVAEFGDGTYGVGAAAQRYFKKTPERLTRHEAALLASVLPNPRRFSARRPSGYVQGRRAWISTQMRHLGPTYLQWP